MGKFCAFLPDLLNFINFKMNKKFIGLSVFTLATAFAYAQELDTLKVNNLKEVVVSDTKFAQSKEKSGKIIEVITAEDLANKQGQSLLNVLSQVAGVEVNGNQSANGKNQGIYIRGGRNRQVAIYIDGVPVTDASNINLEYDLRLLPVDQIERIEILKGSSSVLYGTGAATGVINVVLKKAVKNPINGSAYFSVGTQNDANKNDIDANDFNQGFSINGNLEKVSYLTSLNSTETKGFSEAAGENYEPDSFSRINFMQKIGVQVNDKLSLDFFGNYDKLKNTFDNSFGGFAAFNDDLNNRGETEQFRFGFNPKYQYNKGEFVINSGFGSTKRATFLTNSWTNSVDNYNYESRNVSVDAFNRYNFSEQLYLVLGTQFQFFDMDQNTNGIIDVMRENAKFNIIDPYATVVYNSSFGLNINAGVRANNHSEYGSHWVYNLNPSYQFKNIPLRLLTSYSTAYITPSLYQLYGPFGNTVLTPEENTTAEAGFETKLFNEKLTVNAVGFYRQEQNTFGFFFDAVTFDSFYINNEGKNNAKGVETNVNFEVNKNINFAANYTFTEVEQQFNRFIPKNKVNANANFKITEKLGTSLMYQYVSDRSDAFFDSTTFTSENVNLSSYQLINANVRYQVIPNRLSVFGAIDNIFNEDFQEAIGYNTRGRNFRIGMNFQF